MSYPTNEPSPTTPTPGTTTTPTKPDPKQSGADDDRWREALRNITSSSAAVAFCSVLLAVLVGSLMIMFTDERVRSTFSYIFAQPADFFSSSWEAVSGAYAALFRGSIYNTRVEGFEGRIRPLTETLKFAAPLIAAGLGVGLAFRAALFNIGGR